MKIWRRSKDQFVSCFHSGWIAKRNEGLLFKAGIATPHTNTMTQTEVVYKIVEILNRPSKSIHEERAKYKQMYRCIRQYIDELIGKDEKIKSAEAVNLRTTEKLLGVYFRNKFRVELRQKAHIWHKR